MSKKEPKFGENCCGCLHEKTEWCSKCGYTITGRPSCYLNSSMTNGRIREHGECMTVDEKRAALDDFCSKRVCDKSCHLYEVGKCSDGNAFSSDAPEVIKMTDEEIEVEYAIAFPKTVQAANVDTQTDTPTVDERDRIFREITQTMADVHTAKNHDYGNSFAQLRQKYPISILIRLQDKLNRLDTLLAGDAAMVKEESIEDTLLDLANYAVMELVERRIEK